MIKQACEIFSLLSYVIANKKHNQNYTKNVENTNTAIYTENKTEKSIYLVIFLFYYNIELLKC